MSYKQRSFLTHLNRVVIFLLSLVGLLMDGYDGSDVVFSTTIVLWLWLPHCTRLEAQILEHLENKEQWAKAWPDCGRWKTHLLNTEKRK